MPEVLDAQQMITFDVPGEYRHWRLTVDGRIATSPWTLTKIAR